MVTQCGREQQISASIKSFLYQSLEQCELVIVHDGGNELDDFLSSQTVNYDKSKIRIFKHSASESLGLLRNHSVSHARYQTICQWDDDDLSHPDRLKLQYQHLLDQDADFCFMTDQLHLFTNESFLFWDDWSIETYPNNLIQGTLMGNKDKLGMYPDLPIGEDNELVHSLSTKGHKIAALSGKAWLYLYIYHGNNAWNSDHHKAISNYKRLPFSELTTKIAKIEEELNAYHLPYKKLFMPHEKGKFEVKL